MIEAEKIFEKGMKIMNEKERVILWTSLAAGLLCLTLTTVTLTPLAHIGNGTRFGTPGMYFNLLMCGGSYVIPLILYCLDIRVMKYIIACVNVLWLICTPVIAVICAVGTFLSASGPIGYVTCIVSAVSAAGCFVVTILWYPMCRKGRG